MQNNYILLDGKIVSEHLKKSFSERISKLKRKGILPGLAVILIGDDPASQVYVRNKERDFIKLGLNSRVFKFDKKAKKEDILSLIDHLNKNDEYHGILVQLPLPEGIDEFEIVSAISPDKDADGLHPYNIGTMTTGRECPFPCTPHGILKILEFYNIDPAGKHVAIVGRSNIVGKPLAILLMQKRNMGNATVTVCHSRTENLKEITKTADILVAAIGKPEFIKREHIKDGVVIIDVGINRVEDKLSNKGYRLTGDVDFNDVLDKVSAITPVPGGVGLMTTTMLIHNTLYLAEKKAGLI